jgi:hypothetical protein
VGQKKVLVLGDLHGSWTAAEMLLEHLSGQGITWDEIWQVGDFGFWPGMTEAWSYPFDCPTKWIDGNHEHFHRLALRDQYFGVPENQVYMFPWVDEWQALLEQWEHIPRGTVDNGVLFIGGAFSIDRANRKKDVSWFQEEMISKADEIRVWKAIEEAGADSIHTVITHDCPQRFRVLDAVKQRYGLLAPERQCPNRLFLDAVFDEVKPDYGLFGHYHIPWSAQVDGCQARCISLIEDWDWVILELED